MSRWTPCVPAMSCRSPPAAPDPRGRPASASQGRYRGTRSATRPRRSSTGRPSRTAAGCASRRRTAPRCWRSPGRRPFTLAFGSQSPGSAGAVGISVGVNRVGADVTAYSKGSTVTSGGSVIISAESSIDIEGYAYGGALSAAAGRQLEFARVGRRGFRRGVTMSGTRSRPTYRAAASRRRRGAAAVCRCSPSTAPRSTPTPAASPSRSRSPSRAAARRSPSACRWASTSWRTPPTPTSTGPSSMPTATCW